MVVGIINALNATDKCRCWSQPTGEGEFRGAWIKFGVEGGADISGILVGGKRFELEVKTGKARQQKNQIYFQDMIRMYGGEYKVVHSIDEALGWLNGVVT